MRSLSRGIVYIATGPKYINEAIHNARFSKCINPDLSFALITDNTPDYVDHPFDFVYKISHPALSYEDKIRGLNSDLPYDLVLFLDSDALLIKPISSIFSLLETFDICACMAPVSHPPGWTSSVPPQLFPEYNSGVILFRNSPVVSNLFSSWLSLYQELKDSCSQLWDQASFRQILWQSIEKKLISFYTLPSEFNIRTTKPWTVSRGSYAYVLHGRFDTSELDEFIHYVNRDPDCFRTWAHWLTINPGSSIKPRFDRTNYNLF